MTAATVRITRSRHPLEGRSLTVLGRVRRHGRLELLVVLPDGSKTLVPAAWTDHDGGCTEPVAEAPVSATLGSVTDLLATVASVTALMARRGQAARQSPCKEDSHAARTAQSAHRPGPGATPDIDGPTPEPHLAAAVTLLAGLIAKAATPNVTGTQASRDE